MSILHRIVDDTRDIVEISRRKCSLEELRNGPFFNSPTLSLARALKRDDLSFIAEIKKASPSKGIIRYNFDVRSIAISYKHGGASAISVLTEPMYFHGSLQNLALARQAVDLPIMRKDFIVDPYQLYEARAFGADAVLLIAAVLERSELSDLHAQATELGLSCLVEVYHPSELERIDFDQVSILGVNNRDLNTFDVNVNHSVDVFRQAPRDLVRVSESGLEDPADLVHLRESGIDAALIGETFMRAENPGRRLHGLRQEVNTFVEVRKSPLRRVV